MKKLLALGLTAFAAAALSASAADAKAAYEKECAKCHGADGKGDTKMGKKLGAKDYTDAKVQAELKEDAAVKAIKEGLKDKEGKVVMKPLEGASDADIKALVETLQRAAASVISRRRCGLITVVCVKDAPARPKQFEP